MLEESRSLYSPCDFTSSGSFPVTPFPPPGWVNNQPLKVFPRDHLLYEIKPALGSGHKVSNSPDVVSCPPPGLLWSPSAPVGELRRHNVRPMCS